jgi:multiple sugar transport system permease protein
VERAAKQAVFLLLPFLIFAAVFIAYPLVYSAWLTFQEMDLSDLVSTYIGLGNWQALGSDPVFIQSTVNTVVFLLAEVAISIPVGLGLALLLNEKFRGRSILRSSLLLPWATPPIVTAVMFTYIFSDQYGVVNFVLQSLHIVSQPITFFTNPHTALFVLVIIASWKQIPLFAFIFLSALLNIPSEVVESAKIYKASALGRFRHITFQYLRPTMVVNSILCAILSVQIFDIVWGITRGGPGYSTYMLYFLAYFTSIPYLHLGYGATMAYVVSIISVLFAFVVLRAYKVD